MILQGNSLEVLKTLETGSVNMCITSPPYYGLRDYGTAIWSGGDENCDHKQPYHRGKTAQVGNQLNEADAKQYEEVCEKCGAVKQEDHQIGLEETPTEYINKLCDVFDEVKRVLRNDGSCWVNLGDSYSGGNGTNRNGMSKSDLKLYSGINNPNEQKPRKFETNLPPKCLIGIPAMFQLEMVRRGWILRNVIIWHKPGCMPSSVKDRYTIDFEYLFFFVKQPKYYFKQQIENVCGQDRNKRCVWSINTASFKEAHFAVYPEKLIESPIDAGCPVGGVVLDCFFGAGTTGVVAKKQGKNYVGIELNPEYIEIAKKRLKKIEDTINLFEEE